MSKLILAFTGFVAMGLFLLPTTWAAELRVIHGCSSSCRWSILCERRLWKQIGW
jgi:hypothetical protein